MVGVKGRVIQVEEAQPVPLRDGGVAAHRIVLVAQPHQQDNVERCCCVLKSDDFDAMYNVHE